MAIKRENPQSSQNVYKFFDLQEKIINLFKHYSFGSPKLNMKQNMEKFSKY